MAYREAQDAKDKRGGKGMDNFNFYLVKELLIMWYRHDLSLFSISMYHLCHCAPYWTISVQLRDFRSRSVEDPHCLVLYLSANQYTT